LALGNGGDIEIETRRSALPVTSRARRVPVGLPLRRVRDTIDDDENVLTEYQPDPALREPDFRRRRKKSR
jgi:hypothetical protein